MTVLARHADNVIQLFECAFYDGPVLKRKKLLLK